MAAKVFNKIKKKTPKNALDLYDRKRANMF